MSSGLQTIINRCNSIKFNRRNVVGIQYTRNEIPRVSATPTRNPWKITIEMPNSFRYNEARALMEELDTLDQTTPQVVTFGDNANLSWIFSYQGSLSSGQITTLTVQSYVGDQLTLTGLPAGIPASTYLFKKNDLIQIAGHPYPFTTTVDVLRGTGSTVTFQTSRPNIITSSVVGLGVIVGNKCQFNLFCPNMPVYKLIVGGYQKVGSTVTNNALIEWSDNFYMYEFVGTA
jgi:hypothetical protein